MVMLAVAICVGITGKILIGEVPDVITVSLFSTGSVFIGLGLLGDLINARKPNTLS